MIIRLRMRRSARLRLYWWSLTNWLHGYAWGPVERCRKCGTIYPAKERDYFSHQTDRMFAQKVDAEARADRLAEAAASALTSLGTGPGKDGYAYAVLDAALADDGGAAG